jgi:F0F1-type ATP synthase membrane subunit b/b'
MLWFIIRTIIWVTGFIVVSTFVLNYFGYEPNWHYLEERRSSCEEDLKRCRDDIMAKNGRDDIEAIKSTCQIECVNPRLFIQKTQ